MPGDTEAAGPILFAYDGSKYAKAAIEQAGAQLRPGRRAIVLTVVTPLEAVPFAGPFAALPAEVAEDMFKQADSVAREGAELASAAGFESEPLVEHGTPIWERIIEVADANDAGVIVIGSKGHSGIGYVLVGSVASAVTHHAKQPVLITRGAAS